MAKKTPSTPETEIAELKQQVAELTEQLTSAELRLREMSIADPLTGLYSYRYFLGRIAEEVSRADRFGLEVSCILLAIDTPSFEALLEISRLLKESCRTYDIPARWGQNELVMLLPATDIDGAQIFAERFRLQVESTYQAHPSLAGLTVSLGVTAYPTPGIEDAQQLLEVANGALHAASQGGGNKTMVRS